MKRKTKENCKEENCTLSRVNNCDNPVICPKCNLPMILIRCYIPREEMHFNHHIEACSEWTCRCGFSAFQGIVTEKLYPYNKVVIEK